jgi:hypothetical protein
MVSVWEWFDNNIKTLAGSLGSPINNVIVWLDQQLSLRLAEGLILVLEKLEPEAITAGEETLREVLKSPNLTPTQRHLLENALTPSKPINMLVVLTATLMNIGGIINAESAGMLEKLRQESMGSSEAGLLGPLDVLQAMRRGYKGEVDLQDEYWRSGFTPAKMAILDLITKYMPNPGDLIRFVVRDAFREDIVAKYGYDTDFDRISSDLDPYLKALGMQKDTMRLYWRSHWQNIGINQAYELLHRGLISLDDIRFLLKVEDVAPVWHEALIKASYNPYTRVDVRRMYAAGVLNIDEVRKNYMDLGYDQEHAEKLTEWTIKEASGERLAADKDLLKSEILTGFLYGELTQEEALQYLQGLGYDQTEAQFLLVLKMDAEERKYQNDVISVLKQEYSKGIKSMPEVLVELDSLGLTEKHKNLVLRQINLSKRQEATKT